MLGSPGALPACRSGPTYVHVSEGGALRLLLRVPLLSHRVSLHVLQGTRAERRPQLYVDGGNIKVDEILNSPSHVSKTAALMSHSCRHAFPGGHAV